MFTKIGALAVLTLCLFVGQSVQQECVPKSVANLRLVVDHYLIWNISIDEQCDIDEFLVYIFHPDQPAEYAFSVRFTLADVSFLEVCEEWVFVVIPVSGHTNGPQLRLVDKLPLPRTADLSVVYMNMTFSPDTSMTSLYWDINGTQLGNCSLKYRVTIEEVDETGISIVSDGDWEWNGMLMNFLSPCVTYQVSVKAINVADPTIEGPIRTETFTLAGRVQQAPVILDYDTTTTTANMSLRFESEVRNPCLLKELYIEIVEYIAGGSTTSQTIDISNADRSSPMNVTIENLEPDAAYILYVYVSNTAGRSKYTSLMVWTDPVVDTNLDSLLIEKKEE